MSLAPGPDADSFDDALVESLRLALISGVGPLMRQALLERFGSPEAVFAASHGELTTVRGVGPKIAERVMRAPREIDPRPIIAECVERDIDILVEGSPEFPAVLSEIPDPPGILFCRGKIQAEDRLAIGIVGTRHCSRYGRKQAYQLAAGLARAGLTVVSGLARGIDGEAHRGALEAGGRTIAVLASGVLNIFPPEHVELASEVAAQGAVISESPPQMEPLAGMFPQRNRIISGLSLGVIVVEAAERSGALITSRHAMEQGRDVFAVPGPIDSRQSRGCHRLIKDGAKLVDSIDDVLEELGPLFEAAPRPGGQEIRRPAELQLNEIEAKILNSIATAPTQIDVVVAESGLPVHQVLATISVLEMRRLIRRVSGNQVVRV